MYLPTLDARSRVMMFAPHPDDESLAAGVFLQRAAATGAAVRIVYGTDGEKNCWPQRLLERKVRIRDADRLRWGARRRAEALAALQTVGIGLDQVEFLALPDQGVTDLLLAGSRETVCQLADTILAWAPTHLLVPSAADTHPDHSGLAVLLRIAFEHFLPRYHRISRIEYLIHGESEAFARAAQSLPQTSVERRTKQRAIACHVTQVALSRRRFLAYAKRPERFVFPDDSAPLSSDGPIRFFRRDYHEVCLQVAFTLKPLRAQETSLYLIGYDARGGFRRLRATLPGHRTKLDLIDCATGSIAGIGRYWGDAFRAEISLPMNGFAPGESVFLKLDRRVWFFDEAGWLEIGAVMPRSAVLQPRPRPARALALA
jgi:LmbE family N-acetylglucosaminyl deacetylase